MLSRIQTVKHLISKYRLPDPNPTSQSLNNSPVKEEDDSDESEKAKKPDISNIMSDSDDQGDDAKTGKIPTSSKIFICGLAGKSNR